MSEDIIGDIHDTQYLLELVTLLNTHIQNESVPHYLKFIYENGDDNVSIESEGFLDEDSEDSDDEFEELDDQNYFPQANKIFKDKIKNDKQKTSYNECCEIVMGDNNDFCGKFNNKYYSEAYDNIESNFYEYITDASDDFVVFFTEIFKEIIYTEHEKIIKILNKKVNKILKNYPKLNKVDHTDDCFICAEKLQKKVIVKPPCGHVIHRQCLKTCLLISMACPLCKTKLK
jgi:hypothetical protein